VAFKWKIFMNHFNILGVLFEHLLEYRHKAGTGRSLKVTEHNDYHRRFDSSLERT
jgi:hypothetical protein